jgi:hypothetical protein
MTYPKQRYHVKVQRKKTGRYGKKQHYQKFLTLPAPLCLEQGIETGQIFEIIKGEGGTLTLSRVNSKPVEVKLTYQEWLRSIGRFIPTQRPGGVPSAICREAGLPFTTCPAIWVRQAEAERELERFYDPVTRRVRWVRPDKPHQPDSMQKLKDAKLTDLPHEALPLRSVQPKNGLKPPPVAKVEAHGTVR